MSKRYRLKSKFRFSVFSLLLITVIYIAVNAVFGLVTVDGSSFTTYKTITVHAGDTLWNIASANIDETVDIREYIFEVKKVNNLQSDVLVAGQEIMIPDMNS